MTYANNEIPEYLIHLSFLKCFLPGCLRIPAHGFPEFTCSEFTIFSDIIKIRNTLSIYDLLVDTLFTVQPPGSYRQLKYCQHASEPEHEITIIIIWMLTVSNQPDMHKNDDSVKYLT